MTFGTLVKTLREDKEIWWQHTGEITPNDHQIFVDLGKKGRKLILPIPGVACHTALDTQQEKWVLPLLQEAFYGRQD